MNAVKETQSFPKQLRLTTKAEFNQVFDKGRRVQGAFFTILVTPNNLSHPRLGMIVAKRKLKRATDRNYLRRIIRESFRLTQQEFASVDCLVILRKTINQQEKEQLREDLSRQWARDPFLAVK